MTKKIRAYSKEFNAEAVKKIADNNSNTSVTAKLNRPGFIGDKFA